MNKTTKTVALFSALSLMAISCQKEAFEPLTQETTNTEANASYAVQYTIDGVMHQEIIHNESERADLFRHLFALAKRGCEVTVSQNWQTSQPATKEIVQYSTSDEDDAFAWADKMIRNGYKVTITFDEDKGVYNCIARK